MLGRGAPMAKPGATLRVPELKLGMNMSRQTLPRLTRLVAPARTKQIVIFAEAIGAETAAAWGLADQVAADGEARAAALGLAEVAISRTLFTDILRLIDGLRPRPAST